MGKLTFGSFSRCRLDGTDLTNFSVGNYFFIWLTFSGQHQATKQPPKYLPGNIHIRSRLYEVTSSSNPSLQTF